MKYLKAAVLLFLLILLSVSVSIAIPSEKKEEVSPPASMSILYRESEKILVATCMRLSRNETGDTISRFRADTVIDGALKEGELLSVVTEAAEGQQYLLYLTENKSVDSVEYHLLTPSPISVEDGVFVYDGVKLTVDSLSMDI